MMDAMPRPRLPYLSRETTRHGRPVWYVRLNGKRTRLRAEYGTAEFDIEYHAALAGIPRTAKKSAPTGTLAWLIERYRETTGWRELSLATRRQRENIFENVVKTGGNQPFAAVSRGGLAAARDKRASTPHQARNFLDAMRGLFRWALEAQLVRIDPTVGVKNPIRKGGDGFRPWTEDDVTAYERRWPIGTRQRVWLDVLLYTGLRRGDAVRIGRQHVKNNNATLKTEKTDETVTLPILPVLQETLAAGPCGDLTFIVGSTNKPLTKESFGNNFKDACVAAGVPGSAHGVRKIAATRAANRGATVAQLEAIFGWSGGRMAALYTKAADRRRLSIEAIGKLGNDERTSVVAPSHPVRQIGEKNK